MSVVLVSWDFTLRVAVTFEHKIPILSPIRYFSFHNYLLSFKIYSFYSRVLINLRVFKSYMDSYELVGWMDRQGQTNRKQMH